VRFYSCGSNSSGTVYETEVRGYLVHRRTAMVRITCAEKIWNQLLEATVFSESDLPEAFACKTWPQFVGLS